MTKQTKPKPAEAPEAEAAEHKDTVMDAKALVARAMADANEALHGSLAQMIGQATISVEHQRLQLAALHRVIDDQEQQLKNVRTE